MSHPSQRITSLIPGLMLGVVLLAGGAGTLLAAPPPPPPPPVTITEDVANTKHNLSSTGPGDRRVSTTATSEICVFCHTPHGAAVETLSFGAPLWNRRLSTQSYVLYDNTWSFSFEGTVNAGAPTGFSRLCLSCHDGSIALGSVQNAPGSGGYKQTIPITTGAGPSGTMPFGTGELTGDTRRLGTNLRNDHPISFVFDETLVTTKDLELVHPGPAPPRPDQDTVLKPARRYGGDNPGVYDSVQCTSCHNPHAVTYPRFLRAPIVDCAHAAPCNPEVGLSLNSAGQQIICLFCHDKDAPAGNSYTTSTHAVSSAVHEEYPSAADSGNPGYDYDGAHTIGQVTCRNCHDPHTAQGATRLHREGVDTPGGGDTIENTCYLCHSPGPSQPQPFGQPTLPAGMNTGFVANGQRIAPDIYSQFAKDHNLTGPATCTDQVNCGSAMNLQLDDAATPRNHQPVFVGRPQEGVEYASTSPPVLENEYEPGVSHPDTIDTRHIECVDCHNPHQVAKPSTYPAGRIKGMKGITYNDKVVGIETSETGCSPGPCGREPYVYEVCFRCHGNSVPSLFAVDEFPADTEYRSNPRDASPTDTNLSMRGFSNKRLEFSPDSAISSADGFTGGVRSPNTGVLSGSGYAISGAQIGPGKHKAFHPVVAPGRNGTLQLFNQLKEAFGLSAQAELTSLTIQCTDCHNNNYYDRFTNPGVFGPSPAGGLLSGPLTESSLRASDRQPNLAISYTDETTGRVAQPIGPHGSEYVRLLRAAYNTDIANTLRDFVNNGFNTPAGPDAPLGNHFNNFLLCFQCHDRAAFDGNYDGLGTGCCSVDPSKTRFFGNPLSPTDNPIWDANLHQYHLVRTGAYCHECHYNIHSNVEAQNTIYGAGDDNVVCGFVAGGADPCGTGYQIGLPPDSEDGIVDGFSDTHLINFSSGGPTTYAGGTIPPTMMIDGVTGDRPMWFFDARVSPARFRCNLRCHGNVMTTCHYQPLDASGNPFDYSNGNESIWCAGGQAQIAGSDAF